MFAAGPGHLKPVILKPVGRILVGACLATGDRIFATGSDSVSKTVFAILWLVFARQDLAILSPEGPHDNTCQLRVGCEIFGEFDLPRVPSLVA